MHPDSASVVWEPAAVKVAPRTSYDAKFSLPWSVAALLLDGDIAVATYDPGVGRPPRGRRAGRAGPYRRDRRRRRRRRRSPGTSGSRCATAAPSRARSTAARAARSRRCRTPTCIGKFLGNAGESARGLAGALGRLGSDPSVTAASIAAAAVLEITGAPYDRAVHGDRAGRVPVVRVQGLHVLARAAAGRARDRLRALGLGVRPAEGPPRCRRRHGCAGAHLVRQARRDPGRRGPDPGRRHPGGGERDGRRARALPAGAAGAPRDLRRRTAHGRRPSSSTGWCAARP